MKKEWPLSEKRASVFENGIKEAISNREYLNEYLWYPQRLNPNIVDGVLMIEATSIESITEMLSYTRNAKDITAVQVNIENLTDGGDFVQLSRLELVARVYHAPIRFENKGLQASVARMSADYYYNTPQPLRPKIGQRISFKDDF